MIDAAHRSTACAHQIEIRILAHVSQDRHLCSFLQSGNDIHRLIASHWLDKEPHLVSDQERTQAKRIVFGIVYGIGSASLSKLLNIAQSQALEFRQSFLDRFPDIQRWIDAAVHHARISKTVRSLLNRRRLLPLIASKNPKHRRRAERQAVNTPIQGTASDIIKLAMVRVEQLLHSFKQRSAMHDSIQLLLNIHDELVYEVADQWLEQAVDMIRTAMEHSAKLALNSTPVPVAVRIGKSLDALVLQSSSYARHSTIARMIQGWHLPELIVHQSATVAVLLWPAATAQPMHTIVTAVNQPDKAASSWNDIEPQLWLEMCSLAHKVAQCIRAIQEQCHNVLFHTVPGSCDIHLVPQAQASHGTAIIAPLADEQLTEQLQSQLGHQAALLANELQQYM
jgi:diadenosine tetraphosphate (Ap4A) HIT family hydrolase